MGTLNRKWAWFLIAAGPEAPRSARSLSPADKLLLLTIADICEDEMGVLRMGERRLAEKVGQSRAWVRLHRGSLVKLGLLYPLGDWMPGQAISWQLFPDMYGAAAGFEPPQWRPSVKSTNRDPAAVFASGHDPGPVRDRQGPLPSVADPGSGSHKDRAVVLAIEPDEPQVRDEEKKRDAPRLSEAEALANLSEAFPGIELVAN